MCQAAKQRVIKMGMNYDILNLFRDVLPLLGNLSQRRILTLGVQDCYFTFDEVVPFLAAKGLLRCHLDRKNVQLTTGFKWATAGERDKYAACIHQKSLFAMLGFSPDNVCSLDGNEYEGADIVHDLNVPVTNMAEAYDLIFDGGTIEHVFSIKDALFNCVTMCRVGGVVVHYGPAAIINHGYYNFNAELFHDFYLANGFEKVALKYVATPSHPAKVRKGYLEFEPERMICATPPYYRLMVYSVFMKMKTVPPVVPQQGLYAPFWNTTPEKKVRLSAVQKKLADLLDKYYWSSNMARFMFNNRAAKKVRI
jgi:hypothetical protein